MSATGYTEHSQDDHEDTPKFVPALIVIDMQNDFVSGSLAVPGGAEIVENINSLIDLPFNVKVATKDFHPDNHISFADTHKKPHFSTLMIFHPDDAKEIAAVEQVLWPVHCVANTWGADFVPGLKTTAFDAVVHKGTHPRIECYSAFRDIWGKDVTELPVLLKEKEVTDVYFVGLAGDYCVKYSAIDAMEFGCKTWLVKDAIRSIKDQVVVFDEMEKMGVHFTTTEEVKRLLVKPAVDGVN